MKNIEISTSSKPLAEYAAQLGDGIIMLTSNKKPVAAIVPLDNMDAETLSLSTSSEFWSIIGRARAEVASGKTISLDEMKREFES